MHRLAFVLGTLVLAGLAPGAARPASAQVPRLTLNTSLVFYGDDTEFSNPFRPGQTTVGTYGVAFLAAPVGDLLTLRAGAFGNWHLGSEKGVDQARPVLALVIRRGSSQAILGTLDTMRHVTGAGPDRTGPHGLLPPMQQETLSFDRAYESGLQWTVDSPRYTHDAWINWQRMNTRARREIFDVGMATLTHVRPELAIRGDVHMWHRGGQHGGVEPVSDSLAVAAGIEAGGTVGANTRLTLELAALGSRNVPDRAQPDLTTAGFATFLRFAVEVAPWRLHLILWRADDFIKVEGDPLYQSIRHDGTRYLPVRDYAELGLTRRFALSPDSFVEASLRLHRPEDNYEISFRVLGVAYLKFPVLK